MTGVYIDTSALGRLLLAEPDERPARWRGPPPFGKAFLGRRRL